MSVKVLDERILSAEFLTVNSLSSETKLCTERLERRQKLYLHVRNVTRNMSPEKLVERGDNLPKTKFQTL